MSSTLLEAEAEVSGWLEKVCEVVRSGDTLMTLTHFAMGSVQDPDNCDCGPDNDRDFLDLKVYHGRHRHFNSFIFRCICDSGLRLALIAECERELARDTMPDASDGPWGHSVNHRYASELLDNFLINPNWCWPELANRFPL